MRTEYPESREQITESIQGGAGADGDFTREIKELSYDGGDRNYRPCII